MRSRVKLDVGQLAAVTLLATVLVAGAALGPGCHRGDDAEPPPETADDVAPAERGADTQVFAPLDEPLAEGTKLPLLVGESGALDVACFKALDEQPVTDVTAELEGPIKSHQASLQRLLRSWFAEKLSASDLEISIETWNIAPQDVVTREIDDPSVRFVDDPSCIDSSTGWLENDVHVVAGLFGSRSFQITSATALPRKSADALRKAITDAGMTFETGDLIDYELVTDAQGKAQKGEDGAKMYRSPDEGIVSEKEITVPERQTMKTWSVTTTEPVFFGYRELSKEAWRRESARDECNVNIVWGDPVFREAECPALAGIGFTAAKQGEQIEIHMKSAKAGPAAEPATPPGKAGKRGAKATKAAGAAPGVKTLTLDVNDVEKVQVDDRTILWVSPVLIEEGALIRVNSLVLDPSSR
jgi:hypothetical protein